MSLCFDGGCQRKFLFISAILWPWQIIVTIDLNSIYGHTVKWSVSSGGHLWGYSPGALSFSQISHSKIGHRRPDLHMSCSDLTSKIGHQDSSLRNGHQGDMPHLFSMPGGSIDSQQYPCPISLLNNLSYWWSCANRGDALNHRKILNSCAALLVLYDALICPRCQYHLNNS